VNHGAPECPILTRRLLIRPIDPDRDAEVMYAYGSLPQACRYVPFEPSTRERIAKRLAGPANLRSSPHSDGDALSLAITLRDWRSSSHWRKPGEVTGCGKARTPPWFTKTSSQTVACRTVACICAR
jgi:hypothetical protein